MLDARFSHLYFCQNLNRLQRGLSAIAELLVLSAVIREYVMHPNTSISTVNGHCY